MQYYIQSIEQIIDNEKLKEYGGNTNVAVESTALSKYYKKLSDVSADLSDVGGKHTYMSIKLVSSADIIIKQDSIGAYVEDIPTETPNTQ